MNFLEQLASATGQQLCEECHQAIGEYLCFDVLGDYMACLDCWNRWMDQA